MASNGFLWIDRNTLTVTREEALQLWIDISENKHKEKRLLMDIANYKTSLRKLRLLLTEQNNKYLELTHKIIGVKKNE